MSFEDKDNRLDSWNTKKKIIDKRININYKKDGNVKFRIRPWSIWWFEVGENIGSETGCHFNKLNLTTQRPCIVISTNNFNYATYNKKVIVMPLTSVKKDKEVKHFQYKLRAEKYKEFTDKNNKLKYVGLAKDSLVVCNDIKTIDTKRLIEPIYKELDSCDIRNIKKFMAKYLGV